MAGTDRSANPVMSQTEETASRPPPRSILFLCGRNSIRSPMAELLARKNLPAATFVTSAGVKPGERDPFVDKVLAEENLSLGERMPQRFEELEDSYFDLIITLSPEAHHRAMELTRTHAVEVEYWPTFDPSVVEGTRDQILAAYRVLREYLKDNIARRFSGS